MNQWTTMLASDLLRAPGRRFPYIDIMRGFMVALVVVAHTYGQADLRSDSWLYHLNPTGWATKVFVMLTGFSAVIILGAGDPQRAAKIYRRALEVGLIAWLSNALSMIWSHRGLDALIPALSFQLPWSISQYLIPTTVVLLLAPTMARIVHRIGAGLTLLLVLLLSMLVDAAAALGLASEDSVLGALLYGNPIVTIPLLHYIFAALAALCFAIFVCQLGVRHNGALGKLWAGLVGVGLGFLIIDTFFEHWLGDWNEFVNPIVAWSRFVVFMHFSLWCSRRIQFHAVRAFVTFVTPIGRSALLVFIAHRPVVHGVGGLMRRYDMTEALRLGLLLVLVFAILQFGLWLRKRLGWVDHGLARVGL
jgi:hypothetical protein